MSGGLRRRAIEPAGQVRWFEWANEPVPLVSYYPDSKNGQEVEVKIAKSRNGPVGRFCCSLLLEEILLASNANVGGPTLGLWVSGFCREKSY
ncbi:hypothetical protein [Rossellomorea vietnamensis]|uniref:hypothetical protein n=1 Tax=Rossellomorea vietnamensis TaxID=218284 RepID=UPI0012DEE2B1|nr:hypothetical protein [Rossellomorea vietnamensis]